MWGLKTSVRRGWTLKILLERRVPHTIVGNPSDSLIDTITFITLNLFLPLHHLRFRTWWLVGDYLNALSLSKVPYSLSLYIVTSVSLNLLMSLHHLNLRRTRWLVGTYLNTLCLSKVPNPSSLYNVTFVSLNLFMSLRYLRTWRWVYDYLDTLCLSEVPYPQVWAILRTYCYRTKKSKWSEKCLKML